MVYETFLFHLWNLKKEQISSFFDTEWVFMILKLTSSWYNIEVFVLKRACMLVLHQQESLFLSTLQHNLMTSAGLLKTLKVPLEVLSCFQI